MNYNYGESCPQCGKSIPDYSNLDFHIATEHKAQEVTQRQLEDARTWWSTTKHKNDKSWADMKIGERQMIISRYSHWMWNKYTVNNNTVNNNTVNNNTVHEYFNEEHKGMTHYVDYGFTDKEWNGFSEDTKNSLKNQLGKDSINEVFKFCKKCVAMRQFLPNGYDEPRHCDVCGVNESFTKERDLKPTGKNHGTDDYINIALDDYINGTTHTPEEYEKKVYGLELHVKDWWDSRNVKNEKGLGKRRKWSDLNSDERKEIKKVFKDKVRDEYLESNEKFVEGKHSKDSDTKSFISNRAIEGGFGSGKIGHVKWMRDIEYGGNYKVCATCKVNTSFENNKCLICGN